MAKLSPIGNNAQFINGIPANGAKIFTYAAGSSTKQTTYTDEAGTIPQANPIILDSRGEPSQPIWLTEGLSYKFVFTASTDSDPPVSPIWDIDDVTGINDASISIDQWVDSGVQPTYVSATQFTLPGDQTSAFTVGRRGKFLVTAGTVYGTFSASVFGALTTVTVTMDSGQALDSGLSSVQLALLTPNNGSLPYNLSAGAIQNQDYTSYPTGGTSTAYTATPFPALTSYTDARLALTLNATPGASPTQNWSGLGAKNWKYYDSTGAKQFVTSSQAANGQVTDNWYDGTDIILLNPLPPSNTGKIAQLLTSQTGLVATGTTQIPDDNTIPQITEGDQYITLAITPTNASSKLEIDVTFNGASSVTGNMTVALFQDATANALQATTIVVPSANFETLLSLKYIMTAGTTSATTFRVRAGLNTAGTLTFNGSGGVQLFGGVCGSRLTIKEILP